MTNEQIIAVEQLVNDMILSNVPVITELMTPEAAVEQGAMALFDEKYGETVRVVSMGIGDNRYSCELCGGTHARATGDIGLFRLISESGISAGVRRIEAVVGKSALALMQRQNNIIETVMSLLKSTGTDDMLAKVTALQEDKKHLEKEVVDLRRKVAMGGASGSQTGQDVMTVNGTSFIGKILPDTPAKELKPLVDEFKKKIGSGVIALIASFEEKVSVVVGVTSDLTDKYNAVDFVRLAAGIVGGKGGGGRPDMAQAGGSDVSKMQNALQKIQENL